ncbi:heme oxygenase [Sphingomonas gellani]|uniref:Heme oxygenase n=1 Tax=Sphingomonas gellani TaxID=1166340 RepID=A0A1H8BEH2_9SPHN|nr:biliverdin-producing heme oxygenase [Sphingomonas gellani]SEM81350.1 heme oxygenase [Sphingomonas gellani]
MTPTHDLRDRTRACHDAVDTAFGAHDLGDRGAYAQLLTVHARAVAAAEAALGHWPELPAWRARMPMLAADLDGLDVALPAPLPFSLANAAQAWGALYVLEGSRLGNAMLARSVGPGLPHAYMAARHEQGGWRALLAAIDARAEAGGAQWLDDAVAGAEAAFALFLDARRTRLDETEPAIT